MQRRGAAHGVPAHGVPAHGVPAHRGGRGLAAIAGLAIAIVLGACGAPAPSSLRASSDPTASTSGDLATASSSAASGSSAAAPDSRPQGEFTLALAGDVNFAERTASRLDDPATAFAEAAPALRAADVTMVNLETAIAVGGAPADKSFTFRAPPAAFDALRDAGIDVATMANNHAADYGAQGLQETLSAIETSGYPVVGIGRTAAQAYAPWYVDVRGTRVAVLAATQIQDETLRDFTSGAHSPGVASAYSDQLIESVRAARSQADVVVVYLHWGTEYASCPNSAQRSIADELVEAGATAVVGTHAHVLQGDGWRPDGAYVAYGLGNYLWWRSFGNEQDDNGVLTLTFRSGAAVGASFAPSHLDDRGIPVPATGAQAQRIADERDALRGCTGLLAAPPNG